jgi:hypothetical protein
MGRGGRAVTDTSVLSRSSIFQEIGGAFPYSGSYDEDSALFCSVLGTL